MPAGNAVDPRPASIDAVLPAPRLSRTFRMKALVTWLVLIGLLGALFISMDLDTGLIKEKLPFLLGLRLSPDGFLQGAALTLLITLCSSIFCFLLGALTALGRVSHSAIAWGCATFYVSLFRGTPLLVQVLIIYLALPQVGIVLGALSSGVIALSLNYGAYLAEIIRSGVLAVPKGQKEAAMALGLSHWNTVRYVTAPLALRIILPPSGSLFISMLKDSSLVSLMGLWELNFLAQSYGRSTYHYMEMLVVAAAIYWLMSVVLELLQGRLERKFSQGFGPHR
ncbi:amino acid ABC transporter permease [Affinibrenneria salicis]|uniref:Amino acid ABC transporter permease n=2 Tax=Affinibrenneria salicis TaxID=2590031 RepID=A0A5J5G402_9GAMM|nr:amino acid ABC transporter permease [Affinibrenneria salicis]